jgi:transcriptional regulator with XRE-family HTH domain
MNVTSACTSATESTPQCTTWSIGIGGKSGTTANAIPTTAVSASPPTQNRPLHRLREVRRREGITHTKVARSLGISVSQVQDQEQPLSDIRLSDLYRWQQVLATPASELLHEPDGELSPPVQLRARLVRIMKTVRSIQEAAQQSPVRRLAGVLEKQLVELMPELKDTVSWPAVGHRRKQEELGQAYFRGLALGPINESDFLDP